MYTNVCLYLIPIIEAFNNLDEKNGDNFSMFFFFMCIVHAKYTNTLIFNASV